MAAGDRRETTGHAKMTWAAKHANALLGIGGALSAGLLAWLFSTVNGIENTLIRMEADQGPIYGEQLHIQDELEHLRIRVMAQEMAMKILGYPVPELITDDAAKHRDRATELEQKLKAAEAEANKPFWEDILGKDEPEQTVDQSEDVSLPQVSIPNKEIDADRIKRYMDKVQSKK